MIVENVNDATPVKQENSAPQTSIPVQKDTYDEDFVNKLLHEKKTAMARLRDMESELQRTKEEELKRKENWKMLAEEKEKEAVTWREKFEQQNQTLVNASKASSVKRELSKLGLRENAVEKVLKLVDFNRLDYDRDTGLVSGASESAKMIAEDFPELFGPAKVGVNQAAPTGVYQGEISLESWQQLPYKERKALEPELWKKLGVERR